MLGICISSWKFENQEGFILENINGTKIFYRLLSLSAASLSSFKQ